MPIPMLLPALFASTLLFAPAVAQEEPGTEASSEVQEPDSTELAAQRDRVELRSGKVLYGTVVEYDLETAALKFQVEGGELLELQQRDLHDRSIYRLAAGAADREDSDQQRVVGNYARAVGLWKHSARHYRYALEAAEDEEQAKAVYAEVKILQHDAAHELLVEGKAAMERGKEREAMAVFETMLKNLPEQPQTVEAGVLYRRLQLAQQTERAAKRAKRTEAKVNRAMADPEFDFDKLVEHNREGLLDGLSRKAEKHFRTAVAHGERGLERLDRLVQDDEEAIAEAAKELREDLVGRLVDAQLNLGNHYYSEAKYADAIALAGRALAVDGDDADAKDLRKRAQEAERERQQFELEWFYWRNGYLYPPRQL